MPTARRERFLTPQTSGGHHALVCPYRLVGCDALCQREELVDHLSTCRYRQVSTYFPLHTLLRGRSFTLSTSLSPGLREVCSTLLELIFLFLILIYFHRVFRDSPFTLSFSLSLSLSLALSLSATNRRDAAPSLSAFVRGVSTSRAALRPCITFIILRLCPRSQPAAEQGSRRFIHGRLRGRLPIRLVWLHAHVHAGESASSLDAMVSSIFFFLSSDCILHYYKNVIN